MLVCLFNELQKKIGLKVKFIFLCLTIWHLENQGRGLKTFEIISFMKI